MKKIVVLAAAIAVCFGTAFAEKYVSANDLDVQELKKNITTEDGFVIHATDAQPVKVINVGGAQGPSTFGNETFSRVIDVRGTGTVTARSISIKAKAGETLTVYFKSAGDADRTLYILDQEGNVIQSAVAPARQNPIVELNFKVPSAGEYFVASKGSGIYIYEVILE